MHPLGPTVQEEAFGCWPEHHSFSGASTLKKKPTWGLNQLNSERSPNPIVRKSPLLILKVMGLKLIEICSTRETANWSWSWMQLTWKTLFSMTHLEPQLSRQAGLWRGKSWTCWSTYYVPMLFEELPLLLPHHLTLFQNSVQWGLLFHLRR